MKKLMNRSDKHRRIKRQRKAKRLAARFITALTMLLIILTFAGSIVSFAGSSEGSKVNSARSKHYASILIYPGDSLDSVAESHMCPEQNDREKLKKEIIAINHLSPEGSLSAGNHIIVPCYNLTPSALLR